MYKPDRCCCPCHRRAYRWRGGDGRGACRCPAHFGIL